MKFDNSYAHLPERFSAAVLPTPVKAPRLIAFNRTLAEELLLDVADLDDDRLAAKTFLQFVLVDRKSAHGS